MMPLAGITHESAFIGSNEIGSTIASFWHQNVESAKDGCAADTKEAKNNFFMIFEQDCSGGENTSNQDVDDPICTDTG